MKLESVVGALVVVTLWGSSGCCFGGSSSSGSAPLPGTTPGYAPPAPPPAPPPPTAAQMVMVSPGFAPDPAITSGVAGGPMQAQSLAPTCYAGSYPAQPQLTVRVSAPMPSLSFVVNAEADLTMAVRRPDGTFTCDDDGGVGLNPRVDVAAVPGDYTIYVGTFSGSADAPYTLGVTSIAAYDAPVIAAAPIRHGHLRVLTATGNVGITPGILCDYVQVQHSGGTYDVRWRVRCGETWIYGDGSSESSGGYQYSSRPTWPPGSVVRDERTSRDDEDPLFVWDTTQIHIADDGSSWTGRTYDLTLALVD